MKKLLSIALLLASATGCQTGLCPDGCYEQPATFYFIITDNKGQSLVTSTSDTLATYFKQNGQLTLIADDYRPYDTVTGSTKYVIGDRAMAAKSENDGIQTFYLKFKGKTDTLGLDIHRVPANSTAGSGGNSKPVVTFNGRPMQSVYGGTDVADYFVLKRR